jgi:hypothetical protein
MRRVGVASWRDVANMGWRSHKRRIRRLNVQRGVAQTVYHASGGVVGVLEQTNMRPKGNTLHPTSDWVTQHIHAPPMSAPKSLRATTTLCPEAGKTARQCVQ